ncbi:MAG: hypothetical protein NWE96_06140 [Candidatus Bathyarchaeota archaeon]|nr:hypothetical protein [Candidatus Bathyarchaeota archaeon]
MVKTALLTPAYLSVAWALMVSYQIFTQTAVTTVVNSLAVYVPVVGLWLASRIDMVIFVYAFAWVFVLSSIIPTLLLGKERSVFVQFLVCLILTLMGFILIDVLAGYGFNLNDPAAVMANPYTQLFSNIFFAAFYLSLPYIFMLAIDVRGRKKRRLQNDRVKKLTEEYFKEKPSDATTQT